MDLYRYNENKTVFYTKFLKDIFKYVLKTTSFVTLFVN